MALGGRTPALWGIQHERVAWQGEDKWKGKWGREGMGKGEGQGRGARGFHFLLALRAVSVSVSVLASCYRLPINSVPALAIVDFIDASAAQAAG